MTAEGTSIESMIIGEEGGEGQETDAPPTSQPAEADETNEGTTDGAREGEEERVGDKQDDEDLVDLGKEERLVEKICWRNIVCM